MLAFLATFGLCFGAVAGRVHPHLAASLRALLLPRAGRAADQRHRAEPAQPGLHAVYTDETLITKVVQVQFRPPLTPGSYPMYTCSSTAPVLMLTMLETLDVTDGCRVLEIGTGTGYNAALLCERLGSEYVTSVDIDPELIELATERLAANGYTPTLAAVDGSGGYPPGAPYDRIIATCGVLAIPPAWLEQAAPSAVIVVDVRGKIGGTLARLTVNHDGVATGRFLLRWASFMSLRHTLEVQPPAPRPHYDEPVYSVSAVDPKLLRYDGKFGFVAQWYLPDVTWGPASAEGEFGLQLYAPDGSRALARRSPTGPGWQVTQYGPRRLWDRVEEAHEFWQQAGRPSYDRFGITASTAEQYVWYDHPESEHRWPLPTPIQTLS
ncbi:MAG: methyltransferase domain-containing protein [Pseudonocardiales bacterium]|nr:methyltransferase domain-containing protein [Pseudonocardiales bacterium]